MPLPQVHEADQRAMRAAVDGWDLARRLGVMDAVVLNDENLADLQADLDALDLNVELRRARQKIIDLLYLAQQLSNTLTPVNVAAADTVAGVRTLLAGGTVGGGGGPGPAVGDGWLLEDGAGFWLLEDGAGFWLLES